MICKKKNQTWVFGTDRKFRPSGSLFLHRLAKPRDAKQWQDFLSAPHSHVRFLYSIPSENLGYSYLVCKRRFSAIFTSADKSFLAYPTGISMNQLGNAVLHQGVLDVRMLIVRFWGHFACFDIMLTPFSAKRLNVNILDRNRTKYFVIEKYSYFCIKLIK